MRIASLCLQLVYYLLFSLHDRVGPNMLFWRYVIDLALRNWSLSPWSLRHSVRVASLCLWLVCYMLFFLHGRVSPNMLFWRYVIDLALHNRSISGLLLFFQNLRPLQMIFRRVYAVSDWLSMCVELPLTFLLHLLHLLLQLHGAGKVAVAVGEHANKQLGQDVESVGEVAGAASSTAVAVPGEASTTSVSSQPSQGPWWDLRRVDWRQIGRLSCA